MTARYIVGDVFEVLASLEPGSLQSGLDLFCGAGGASMGYHRAGFEMTGVDIRPQPHYPFAFVQADALEYVAEHGREYDFIAASPPCQRYIRSGNVDHSKHPDLLGPTRDALEATGVPWVIENVPGAPMRADVVLCGSMFGLTVRRHRWFEFSDGETRFPPSACDHSSRKFVGVYGHPHGDAGANRTMLAGNLTTWAEGLGIDWMTTSELALAIPPAYTNWIGSRLLESLAAPT